MNIYNILKKIIVVRRSVRYASHRTLCTLGWWKDLANSTSPTNYRQHTYRALTLPLGCSL